MPLTRTAVVVGAGPGLGLALARRFAREGYAVALLARSPERLDLAGLPAASTHAVDLADRKALVAALEAVRERHGDPEVLLFNASATVMGAPTQVDPDAVTDALAVGVVAGVVCAQGLAPAMIAAAGGSLLFTGGGTALKPWAAGTAIGLQKAALRNYVLALHEELAPLGVHAGTVTVHGMIAPATPYAPELIAEAFWDLHTQPRSAWTAEVAFTGAGHAVTASGPQRSVGLVVGRLDPGGDPAALAHLVAVALAHARISAVSTSRGRRAGARRPAAAHPAGRADVAGQRVAQLRGVGGGQVDLVRGAVEGEGHGLVGGGAVEVVDQGDLHFLGHGTISTHNRAHSHSGRAGE